MMKNVFSFFLLLVLSSCFAISNGSNNSIITLGQGWAGNTVNTVIFRHNGILTYSNFQYTAYFSDPNTISFVSRNLTNNEIETSQIHGEYNVFDSHNSISIGIDKAGYLHISYDHHGNLLQYRRSTLPFNISGWSSPKPMTGYREERITYPTFLINPVDSVLTFLYRDGGSSRGQACIKYYATDYSEWFDYETCSFSGYDQSPWTSNPYWNHPVYDNQGRLHISYVWRSRINSELITNLGIDYAYSDDNGRSWFTINGFQLPSPVTQVNSERVWAVPIGSNLINQTSMSVDNEGNPHIVYYANDHNNVPQYQHLWHNGSDWQNTFISTRTEKFQLKGRGTLQIPMSRPEILIDSSNIVYVIFRADFVGQKMAVIALFPPHYTFEDNNFQILWDAPLGFSEPVVDRIRWKRDGILSMLIQFNYQPDGDRNIQDNYQPVHICDWDLISMFSNR